MSTYDTDNTLLFEMLGKGGGTEVFTTAAQSSKDFYAVHFPVTSVVSSITADGVTGESALQTTLPAGTTLFMRITAIQLTSGIGIGYSEHDGNADA
tara:strand:+ start:3900 stop:4187 length:288 start_codon:yes stop_codon:yes gene_type:complete